MTFPTINFKRTNSDAGDHLVTLAEEKLRTLDKFIGDAPAVCDVEFEKLASHQSGDIYRVEVNLEVNGKLYRSTATTDMFEKSIDEVRADLYEELSRSREREETMLRRGGRRLKNWLRFGRR